ncbi:hypothetical protein GQ53DRAFT_436789 [Thozetella sp. PMI_491]|nr:hypothetical protein GQ53DRAFT_436789 [Thozetella sp. PMI_491]
MCNKARLLFPTATPPPPLSSFRTSVQPVGRVCVSCCSWLPRIHTIVVRLEEKGGDDRPISHRSMKGGGAAPSWMATLPSGQCRTRGRRGTPGRGLWRSRRRALSELGRRVLLTVFPLRPNVALVHLTGSGGGSHDLPDFRAAGRLPERPGSHLTWLARMRQALPLSRDLRLGAGVTPPWCSLRLPFADVA